MITMGPESSDDAGPKLSWSPDGRQIAFDREAKRVSDGKVVPSLRGIYVLNIADGTVSKLADGMSPSWSSSGEWIAFYSYSPDRDDVKRGWYATNANRVNVVRPDGKDQKVLLTFHRDDSLRVAPVWSPDSKTILVNKFRNEDKATMDIYLLDVATLKLTKKFKNAPPVYAWVAAKGG
jgi:Tol biopolymer transport system component